jgi:ABC-2 type transport system ATP-binding protein
MSMSAVQHTIEVRNLKKNYGPVHAVRGVSFNVKKGEIVGFLGPNGAGKSTVMKILTCFMSATQGEVRVAGHNVYDESLVVRRKVGYQPENVPLYDEMVVYDYLLFMARMRGVPSGRRQQRIQHVVKRCGLEAVMSKLIRELSKGYRQRVGLAQALIHDPDVLILDEPMSGLDPNQIIEIRDLIRDVGQEKTVIFSSHILADVERICHRILIINEGRIVADGTAAELTALLEGRRRFEAVFELEGLDEAALHRELEAIVSQVERVPQVAGVRSSITYRLTTEQGTDVRGRLIHLAQEKAWPLLELRELALTLEDIFRALTAEQSGPGQRLAPPRAAAAEAGPPDKKSDKDSSKAVEKEHRA